MTSSFRIGAAWLPAANGTAEIRATTALLDVVIGDKVVTRFDDAWSKSIQPSARVSAYPLALWIASSWWRLRWESFPFRSQPDTAWRMAHEVAGAGHGYIWPRLTLASDGETVDAICRPSDPLSEEPVHYVADFRESMPAPIFENGLDEFVELVLARLDAVGLSNTDLRLLWNEVRAERADPSAVLNRTLEARLGFEPDEAPEALLARLLKLSEQAGVSAAEELAPACAGSNAIQMLDEVEALAGSTGAMARIDRPASLVSAGNNGQMTPWQRGNRLAAGLRAAYGLGSGSIADSDLAEILAIPVEVLGKPSATNGKRPLGLAVRNETGVALFFRKRNRPALRFEASRFLGDHLSAPPLDRWLPVTDARTARQKFQRAFAVEFLCPFAALDERLGSDFSPEAVEEASEYFGVSELAVESHLANHGRIPFDAVAAVAA